MEGKGSEHVQFEANVIKHISLPLCHLSVVNNSQKVSNGEKGPNLKPFISVCPRTQGNIKKLGMAVNVKSYDLSLIALVK